MSAADFLRGLSLANEAVMRGAERGIAKAGMRLLGDSIGEMPSVPRDEGTLRGSGSVHVNGKFKQASPSAGGAPTPNKTDIAKTVRDGIEATVAFNTDYAAAQHEGFAVMPDGRRIEFRDYTTAGTGAKFLEAPMARNNELYMGIVAGEVRKELSR